MSPIPISELQYLAIANAANALCTAADRDQFVAQVYAVLQGQPIGERSNGRAIRIVHASCPHPEPDRLPHGRPRAPAYGK